MMKRILANDGIDAAGKALLEKAGFEVISNKVAQADLIAFINVERISVLTVRSATKVRKDLIDACPHLQIIGRGGVGMDNIDVDYARSVGKKVINTPAASSHSVAELVMGHLYAVARCLHLSNRYMPVDGVSNFDAHKKLFSNGFELRGKTIGIIGFGRIGQSLASIALGSGMKVLVSDPFVTEAKIEVPIVGVQPTPSVTLYTIPMEEVLLKSDIISIHVPGGEIIRAKEIALMKKGVVLLNASRGGVINEFDLLEGLETGHLYSVALDVFNNEPTPDENLLCHAGISVSPHIGASTKEAQERIGIELAESIIREFVG
jgi:D-3-phosphoglycerate dehydrogenase / 2-oxoglutarate reductase